MKAPKKIKLVVNGKKIRVPLTTLKIRSIDKSMRQIAAKIARGEALTEEEKTILKQSAVTPDTNLASS